MGLTSIRMTMLWDDDNAASVGIGCADDDVAPTDGSRIVAGQIVRANYTRNRYVECRMTRTEWVAPVEDYLRLSGIGA
jgi:hypothetical protein